MPIVNLPTALDAERVVLGCCIQDETGQRLTQTRQTIKPVDMYSPVHQLLYKTLCEMADAQKPTSLLAVKTEIVGRGMTKQIARDGTEAGAADYLAELWEWATNDEQFPFHLSRIRECSDRWKIIRLAENLDRMARDIAQPVYPIVTRGQQALFYIAGSQKDGDDGSVAEFGDAAAEVVNHARELAARQETPGLLTGFGPVDSVIGGLCPGDLCTLAADTGFGKSTYAGQVALNVARQGKRVYVVSREMKPVEVAKRMIQNRGEFEGQRWRHPWDWEPDVWAVVEKQAQELRKQRGIIDSRSATVEEVAARARLLGTRWDGLDLLIVDYLQLLRGPGQTRAQVIGGIAWGLKELAMDLGCVVLLLSQFDRTTNRESTPPTIHGLKESGDIENASNQIVLLWMPDKDAAPDYVTGTHEVHLRVAKNRDGCTTPWEGPGAIRLRWKREWTKFTSAEVCAT